MRLLVHMFIWKIFVFDMLSMKIFLKILFAWQEYVLADFKNIA